MSDNSTTLPLTGPQVLARLHGVTSATAASVAEVMPAVVRPIGLAVALAPSPSAFIRAAKLTRPVGTRSTNALFYS